MSPLQKAQVTRLVKEGAGQITLAIGDGANDVSMVSSPGWQGLQIGVARVLSPQTLRPYRACRTSQPLPVLLPPPN